MYRMTIAETMQAERRQAVLDAQHDARMAELVDRLKPPDSTAATLKPLSQHESGNELRPRRLVDVVGQEKLKPLLARLVASAKASGRPLSHMLFVGAGGTGKTTLATVIANEIGTRTFVLEAPLDMAVLGQLREVAQDRDVVFVDEIHKQVSGDRRGLAQACDPENFYMLLEDGMLATATGPIKFPAVTWIGATTDVGLLPISLSDRFTIQPRLAPYTLDDMTEIAERNAKALGLSCEPDVPALFARASRGVPRQVNNYMRSARDLAEHERITSELAREVVEDLCSTTLDGLNDSMQTVLRFLYVHGERETRDGTVYIASVNSLATACGHGRDTKAISLLVEPYLIQRGLIQVRPQGRALTPTGITRARLLIGA